MFFEVFMAQRRVEKGSPLVRLLGRRRAGRLSRKQQETYARIKDVGRKGIGKKGRE